MPGKEILNELGVAPLLLGILLMFWAGDGALSDAFRADVGQWLKRAGKLRDSVVWPVVVRLQFERAFGEKHFSRRCFSVSIAVSILSFIFISTMFITLFGAHYGSFVQIFIVTILINTVGDYASLMQTRIILDKLSRDKIRTINAVIIDLVLTVIIVFLFAYLSIALLFAVDVIIYGGGSGFFMERYIFESLSPPISEPKITIFGEEYPATLLSIITPVLTTFVTSLWIWAAGLGSLMIRSAPWLVYILPVESKPVRSIGVSALVIVLLLLVGLSLIDAVVGDA